MVPDRYIEVGPEKVGQGEGAPPLSAAGGEWKLTTSERKRISLNHIYGVTLTPRPWGHQALAFSAKGTGRPKRKKASPTSADSPRARLARPEPKHQMRNSLIGSDFYKGQQIALFDEEERTRINAFDWEDESQRYSGKGIHHRGNRGTEEEKGFDVSHWQIRLTDVSSRQTSKNQKAPTL